MRLPNLWILFVFLARERVIGNALRCQGKCGEPQVNNGSALSPDYYGNDEDYEPEEYDDGTTLSVECSNGYWFKGTNQNTGLIRCDGCQRSWSPSEQEACEAACRRPTRAERRNTYSRIRANPDAKPLMEFECTSPNSIMFGNPVVKCIAGDWDADPLPRCRHKTSCLLDMKDGKIVKNASLDSPTSLPWARNNDRVTVVCDSGYTSITGDAEVRCNGGQWDPTPLCVQQDQLGLCVTPHLNNGDVTLSHRQTMPGAVAIHKCRNGFQPSGPVNRTCLHGGAWSGAEVRCQYIQKCHVPTASNGHYEDERGNTVDLRELEYEKTTILQCDQDFTTDIQEPDTRTKRLHCNNGVLTEGTCTENPCDVLLQQNENLSDVVFSTNVIDVWKWGANYYSHGTTADITCMNTHETRNREATLQLTCNKRSWRKDNPICIPKNCSILFDTIPDLLLFHSARRRDQIQSSTYLGHEEHLYLYCPSLKVFSSTMKKTPCTTQCNFGDWSNPAVFIEKCEPAPCQKLNKIVNQLGQVNYAPPAVTLNGEEYVRHGTRASYNCKPNYKLSENVNNTGWLTCDTGSYSQLQEPLCKGKGCQVPSDADSKYVIYEQNKNSINHPWNKYFSHDDGIEVACEDGYVRASTKSNTRVVTSCGFGNWSNPDAFIGQCVEENCSILFDTIPDLLLFHSARRQDQILSSTYLGHEEHLYLFCPSLKVFSSTMKKTPFITQCNFGDWSNQAVFIEKCEPDPCQKLNKMVNQLGQVNYAPPAVTLNGEEFVRHGTRASYNCKPNYKLSENVNNTGWLTCDTGSYSQLQEPLCKGKGCQVPSDADSKYVIYEQNKNSINHPWNKYFSHDDGIEVACEDGYVRASTKSNTRVVTSCGFGNWSNPDAFIGQCVEENCSILFDTIPDLLLFHSARRQDQILSSTYLGHEEHLYLFCPSLKVFSSTMKKTPFITQCNFGDWSNQAVFIEKCEPDPCQKLNKMVNQLGQVNYAPPAVTLNGEEYVRHGTRASYNCKPNYKLSENVNNTGWLTCDTGSYSQLQEPLCKGKGCRVPSDADSKYVIYEQNMNSINHPWNKYFSHDNGIEVACEDGYVRASTKRNTRVVTSCGFGNWSNPDAFIGQCVEAVQVSCHLGNIHVSEGPVDSFISYKPSEGVSLTCRKGYYFDRFTVEEDYAQDFSTGYGFEYDTAPRNLTCQPDGRWDRPIPTCHAFTCSRPATPRNGAIRPKDQSLFQANQSIEYVCAKNTVLVGYSTQTCDMSWNGWSYGLKPPYCMRVRCPGPEGPRNGWITNRDKDVGSTIHYYCDRGYGRYGSPNQTCQANGKWSNVTPICRARRQLRACANPVVPPGSITRVQSTLIGAEVTHRCIDPVFLRGPAKRRCGPLGWSPTSEPECDGLQAFDDQETLARTFSSFIERFSSSEENVQNGYLGLSRGFDVFFLMDSSHNITQNHFEFAKTFVFNIIYKLTLSSSGTAIGLVSFSREAEKEFVVGGGVHADPGRPKQDLFRKLRELKHIDRDTNITGALEFVRKVMIPMTSSARGQTAVPKVVFLISDGDVTHGGNPTSSAKALKDLGVEIFSIKTGTMRSPKTRLILDGVSSSADFPQYYPHFLRIKDVSVLDFMVKNFKRYSTAGFLSPKFPICGLAGDIDYTKSYKIGGDAVNSTTWPWVIAIHKIKDDNKAVIVCTGTLISEQWILTTAKCVSDNRETLMAMSASSPNHQDSEMVKDKFINGNRPGDIALLKLQRPMRIGPYVRPVCLPNITEYIDDKFGDYAVTTGWNQTLEQPKLIQAAVPIREDWHCRGSAQSAGYCAGMDTVVNSTCPQDVGSPLMIKSRLDKKTRQYHWIQIGIAWQDDGCTATGGNTARFIRLEQFMPWIRRTIGAGQPQVVDN